ncbi:uncharacterized protein [Primulina eburnea]|uniref:uncharacterized protein n=1 Tax=Primulina eburnea TaxID=1245227 RepID=UPI003C6C3714
MTSSPPPSGGELVRRSDDESRLSSLVYDLSQNVQTMMDNMLAMIKEIDQNSAGIMKEIENSKDSVYQRKNTLEQEKELLHKTAFSVLGMLSSRDLC